MTTTRPTSAAPASEFQRVWPWPIALALLSLSGLASALVSDRWGDWWSWLALGAPVVVMVWYALRRPAHVVD